MLLQLSGKTRAHDPTIVKEGGVYYRFQTGFLDYYFSKDLFHWEKCARVFSKSPKWCSQLVPGSKGFWAPEVVFRAGEWRIYYSVSTFGSQKSAIGCATSKSLDPSSNFCHWRDRGVVLFSDEKCDFNAIDANVVQDFCGRDWFVWGSFWGGIKMCAMDDVGIKKNAPYFTICSRCRIPNSVEGAFLFAHKGFYYLFVSYDYCCRGKKSTYRIVYGSSKNITGPFLDEDGNDLAQGGGTTLRGPASFAQFSACGHCSIFCDDEKTYIVYHAYDIFKGGKSRLVIEDIEFDEGRVILQGDRM